MRTRETDILIVPGLGDSGPDHWQSRWEAKLPTARRVPMPSWTEPEAAAWTECVRSALAGKGRPVVVVAHGLGVIATVRALSRDAPPVAGAFLVSPPSEAAVLSMAPIDPEFVPFPRSALPCRAVLVASRSDPHAPMSSTEALARDWGATLVDAGEAGHLDSASGHGPWPEGLMSFAGFLGKL